MSRRFYFRQGNDVHGPVTAQQLCQLAADGKLRKTDCIRPHDQDKWYVASSVKGLFSDLGASSPLGPHQPPAPGERSAPPSGPPTEAVIDVEAFERDRKRRLAARRKKIVPVAIGGGVVAVIVVGAILFPRDTFENPGAQHGCSTASVESPHLTEADGARKGGGAQRRTTPAYVVLRDEVIADAPARGHIVIDLLIQDQMSREAILDLLAMKYNQAIRRKVFKNREYANWVNVAAYSSLDHYHAEHTRRRLAETAISPGLEEPRIDFNDVLHKQMFAPTETKYGLPEATRKEIFKDYLHADSRAWTEAEKEYPTDPDLVLKVGDTFYLAQSVMLMGTNNAEEWFAKGCPSMEVPVGTEIKIIQTVKNDQGTKYTQVAAYPPNEHSGYKGWVLTTALGYEHPVLKDKDRLREQLELQDTRAQELKKTYIALVLEVHDISQEVLELIYYEGSEKQWPY